MPSTAPDYPDFTRGVHLFAGNVSQMMAADFPDWVDGVNVLSGVLTAPGDLPDWTKAQATRGTVAWQGAALNANGNPSTSISVSRSGFEQTNDLLVACVYAPSASTVTPPAGSAWKLEASHSDPAHSNSVFVFQMVYPAGGTGTLSTFTADVATVAATATIDWRIPPPASGGSALIPQIVSPIVFTTTPTPSVTATITGVSPTDLGGTWLATLFDPVGTTWTVPAGMTLVQHQTISPPFVGCWDETPVNGPTGTVTSTGGAASNWVTVSMVVA